MRNEWLPTPLKAITLKIGSGSTPKGGKEVYQETGIALIRSMNVLDGVFEHDGLARISDTHAKKLSGVSVAKDDVLVNITGASVARCCLVPEGVLPARVNQHVAIIRLDPEKADARFVAYSLTSTYHKTRLLNIASTGGTREALTKEDLELFELPLPSLPEQQRIGALLSAYDDLIATNAQRQQLLDALARQLYQEWFVRLRFPGYLHVPLENGIPYGWNLLKMREVVEYYIGGGWGAEDADTTHSVGGYVIRGTDIPTTQLGVPNKEVYRFHKPSNIKSRLLQPFDIVFEVSGGSPEQPLGRTVMVTRELLTEFGGNVICASFCKLVRPNVSKISPYYLDRFLRAYYESRLVEIYQIQSTGISNYQFEDFLTYQTIAQPTQEILRQFDAAVAPIYQQVDLIGQRALALRRTRDALLPRLLSGKLTIRAAELALAE